MSYRYDYLNLSTNKVDYSFKSGTHVSNPPSFGSGYQVQEVNLATREAQLITLWQTVVNLASQSSWTQAELQNLIVATARLLVFQRRLDRED